MDVLASSEFGIEAGAEFEHGGNPPRHFDPAGARPQGTAHHLQQGRFAGSVATDNANRLTFANVKGNGLECPEFLVIALPIAREELLQTIFGPGKDRIEFADIR